MEWILKILASIIVIIGVALFISFLYFVGGWMLLGFSAFVIVFIAALAYLTA